MKLSNLALSLSMMMMVGNDDHLVFGQQQQQEEIGYFMPSEEEEHEGTWLQWPHNNGWDPTQENRYEDIWIEMTKALHTGEMVHIIVYDKQQETRVSQKLQANGVNLGKVDFWVYPTNDVWSRDNGPIFAFDENDNLVIQDWGFNGWGEKADEWLDCDYIPVLIAEDMGTALVNVSSMVNEGGSVEVDGKRTLMAKRSSILNENRNPGMTQAEAEEYFTYYLGVTNFIWLEGVPDLDITDDHIDGTARFGPDNTIITMHRDDLTTPQEYDVLEKAVNANGQPYTLVHLPLSDKTVEGGFGGSQGVYVNYYVGNTVVLVPNYDDPQDAVANQILQDLYKDRTVVGVNMEELYKDGGAAHCVTQQQPKGPLAPASQGAADQVYKGDGLQVPEGGSTTTSNTEEQESTTTSEEDDSSGISLNGTTRIASALVALVLFVVAN